MRLVERCVFFLRKLWLVATVLLLTSITFFSLYSLQTSIGVPSEDKLLHFLAYSALAFPVSLRKIRFYWLAILVFAVWGGTIELIQPFFGRYAQWSDMVANTLGLLFGVLLAKIIGYFYSDTSAA